MKPVQAAALNRFCQTTEQAAAEKEALLKATIKGDQKAEAQYRQQISQAAAQLRQCRTQNWPQTQAIWLRLYACDLKPGVLESLMDRIVNKGYNQVYVEVFYDGQVLLPSSDNPTAWPSVIQNSQADLLAQAIQKGRDRGLQVYAWMYSMNFGYSYGQRADRQQTLARNGKGQTSLTVANNTNAGIDLFISGESDKAFIDPYNAQARQDYVRLLQEVLERKPDGVLFDYIRYPKQSGAASVLNKPKDLWIYGPAALQAFYGRAQNSKGRELIRRFAAQGYITAGDVAAVDRLYPQEREPLWQGRVPPSSPGNRPLPPAAHRQPRLQQELWLLAVAHTYQGVVDFLANAAYPVLRQGIPAGAVFFPEANRRIGAGFDSRLQPWTSFPTSCSGIRWPTASAATPAVLRTRCRRCCERPPRGLGSAQSWPECGGGPLIIDRRLKLSWMRFGGQPPRSTRSVTLTLAGWILNLPAPAAPAQFATSGP